MKKTACTLLTSLCISFLIKAQDPHFSQFFSSPLTLNPALTGKFDGNLRVAGNYRNQWPAFNNVYTTSTVSVDFSVLKKYLPDNDTWGIGILALTDKAAGGILTNNYIGLSTSYHKALNEDGYSQIGAGFQATYGQKRLDRNKLYTEDMLTPFGFTGVSSDEVILANKPTINYFDVNAGIIYTGSSSDRNNYYIGASMYHINRPSETFSSSGTWNISPRTTISAGGYFPVSDLLTFHTSAIYQVQSKASETVFGGAFAANLAEDDVNPSTVYAGAWMRWNDAFIPYLGLEFSGLRIGATYDINVSTLRSASQSRGGMEISLIYINRPSGSGKGIPCPKF
jgi:type IX secretion system PorP/SprF family membrane protein